METTEEAKPIPAIGRRYRSWKAVLICGLICCWPADPVQGDVYLYVDSNGVMHFTDAPTTSDYTLYLRDINAGIRKRDLSYATNRFDHIIHKAARHHGVDFPLIKALIKVESDFDHRAVSPMGAKGLMQLMPENLKALRISNPFDPMANIMGGTRYLKELMRKFNRRLPLVLAAYNAGPGAVEKYDRIPPYEETERYVEKVMRAYALLKKSE